MELPYRCRRSPHFRPGSKHDFSVAAPGKHALFTTGKVAVYRIVAIAAKAPPDSVFTSHRCLSPTYIHTCIHNTTPHTCMHAAALLGAPPNLTEVSTAASGADRFELRTETAGTVMCHLEVLASGFAERNVQMGTPRAVTCL